MSRRVLAVALPSIAIVTLGAALTRSESHMPAPRVGACALVEAALPSGNVAAHHGTDWQPCLVHTIDLNRAHVDDRIGYAVVAELPAFTGPHTAARFLGCERSRVVVERRVRAGPSRAWQRIERVHVAAEAEVVDGTIVACRAELSRAACLGASHDEQQLVVTVTSEPAERVRVRSTWHKGGHRCP